MKNIKSEDEYLNSNGWSSSLFVDKAKLLFQDCRENDIDVKIKRSVIYLASKLKLYVHRDGRTKEFMTVCDFKGKELASFHFTDDYSKIFSFILQRLSEE